MDVLANKKNTNQKAEGESAGRTLKNYKKEQKYEIKDKNTK